MERKPSRQLILQALVERDGAYCVICSKDFSINTEMTIDHWIPKSAGGSDDLDNLRLAHRNCNVWKGDRIPNPDGTLPSIIKKQKVEKINKKALKESICHKCNNGRLLKQSEICSVCSSHPEPKHAPHWAKKPSNICSHSGVEWCWACSIGWVSRREFIGA